MNTSHLIALLHLLVAIAIGVGFYGLGNGWFGTRESPGVATAVRLPALGLKGDAATIRTFCEDDPRVTWVS